MKRDLSLLGLAVALIGIAVAVQAYLGDIVWS